MQTKMRLHAGVRDAFGLQGNGCSDCAVAAFCTPCALAQEQREIELEERQAALFWELTRVLMVPPPPPLLGEC